MTEQTDRELLERAAKAEGTVYQDASMQSVYDGGPVFLRPNGGLNFQWNPLIDDADAFRLAVKLNLWEAVRLAHRSVGSPDCPDLYAATRRAVVRAAAALAEK